MRPVTRQRVERGRQCRHGHADLWVVSGSLPSGKPLYQCVGCNRANGAVQANKRAAANAAVVRAAAALIEEKPLSEHLAHLRRFDNPAKPCGKCGSTRKTKWYGRTHCEPCLAGLSPAYARVLRHVTTAA